MGVATTAARFLVVIPHTADRSSSSDVPSPPPSASLTSSPSVSPRASAHPSSRSRRPLPLDPPFRPCLFTVARSLSRPLCFAPCSPSPSQLDLQCLCPANRALASRGSSSERSGASSWLLRRRCQCSVSLRQTSPVSAMHRHQLAREVSPDISLWTAPRLSPASLDAGPPSPPPLSRPAPAELDRAARHASRDHQAASRGNRRAPAGQEGKEARVVLRRSAQQLNPPARQVPREQCVASASLGPPLDAVVGPR